jgi:hypothetical protein
MGLRLGAAVLLCSLLALVTQRGNIAPSSLCILFGMNLQGVHA